MIEESERSPSESITAKTAADLRRWSESLNKPVSIALLIRLLFLEPGFRFVCGLRARELIDRHFPSSWLKTLLMWRLRERAMVRYGCDVVPGATFGGGLFVPHPTGIVIGGEARFGRGITILQGVTVGRGGASIGPPAIGPIVGDYVRIYAGAKIVGEIQIGAHAIVGANAVVLTDVPSNHLAVGVPAKSRANSRY